MKLPLSGSIKGMVTFIVALALLPALGVIIYSGYTLAQSILESTDKAALTSARNIARQQELLVENTRILLLTLSHLKEVQERDQKACAVLFQNLVLQTPVYAEVRLCDTEGNILASAGGGPLSELEREQFLNAVEKNSFGVQELPRGAGQDKPILNCLYPVREDGKITSVLVASVLISIPGAELESLLAKHVESLHLVDKMGNTILVYSTAGKVGKMPVGKKCKPWQSIVTLAEGSGIIQTEEHRSAYEKLMQKGESTPYLTVVLNLSTSAIYEQMGFHIVRNILLLLGASGLALIITWNLCAITLIAPVEKLLAVARRLKDGDLGARITTPPQAKELRILAESFNSMSASLEIRDRELSSARDTANAASRSKSDFLANMSHEIRTPMNAILGMTYLARNSELTAQQKGYLDKVHAEASNLLVVINDILDFSKIEAGKLDIEAVPFSLADTLKDVLAAASAGARDKNLEFNAAFAPDTPETMKGDPHHLSQVLGNILGNAIKYTQEGSVRFACDPVFSDHSSVLMQFTIADTGIGMDEKQVARYFPTDEMPAAPNSFAGASGLNLTITRKLVSLMQGGLEVDSQRGKGTTVIIRIPFAHADSAPVTPHVAPPIAPHVTAPLYAEPVQERDGSAQDILQSDLPDVPQKTSAQTAQPESAGAEVNLQVPHGEDAVTFAGQPAHPDSVPPARQGERVPQPVTMAQARLLLVEDNPINQQIAEEILASAGASVRTADNGIEALKLLAEMPKSAPYHMILMDLQMPELDGFATTRRIRLDEHLKHLPVIAMTAHSMSEEWDECLAAGMDDYISKPIDVPALFATIEKWLLLGKHTPSLKITTATPPLSRLQKK